MPPSDVQLLSRDADEILSTSFAIVRRAVTTTSSDSPLGAGAKSSNAINNKAFFALFGLLGAAMVIASIWFFFWAKNGGFVWRERDWDDYKTTVMRRKDKNGKTLSNATPRTNLGQHSVAGTFDIERDAAIEEKNYGRENKGQRPTKGMREHSDEDVRAYRYEKPAKIGGMNRHHDGNHFIYEGTDASDIVSNNSRVHLTKMPAPAPTPVPKRKGFIERKRERKQLKRYVKEKATGKPTLAPPLPIVVTPRVRPVEGRPSFPATEMSSVPDIISRHSGYTNTHESYFAQYRPQQAPPHVPRHSSPRRSYANSAVPSRQSSPAKETRTPRYPASHDAYSDAGTSDSGSVMYNTQHIPQFGRGTGFRRDGDYGSRRDSLSDGDGDLGSMR